MCNTNFRIGGSRLKGKTAAPNYGSLCVPAVSYVKDMDFGYSSGCHNTRDNRTILRTGMESAHLTLHTPEDILHEV